MVQLKILCTPQLSVSREIQPCVHQKRSRTNKATGFLQMFIFRVGFLGSRKTEAIPESFSLHNHRRVCESLDYLNMSHREVVLILQTWTMYIFSFILKMYIEMWGNVEKRHMNRVTNIC